MVEMNAQTQEIVEAKTTPSELVVASCKVMEKIERLKKADENKFASYMFTSVDDFKDAMRPLMAEFGLKPHITEKDFKLLDSEGKKPQALFKFAITLYHKSGEKSKPEFTTVCLPFVGAQTTGIAKSYALKEWLKSTFMASAGDQSEEADLLNNTTHERLTKAGAKKIFKELDEEMKALVAMRDLDAFRKWWGDEYYRIKTLPSDWEINLKTDWAREGQTLAATENLDSASNDDLDAMAQEQEGNS